MVLLAQINYFHILTLHKLLAIGTVLYVSVWKLNSMAVLLYFEKHYLLVIIEFVTTLKFTSI